LILTTVVLWLHIFGAIGWLGGALVFGIVVGPGLARLSGPARGEFFAKVAPNYVLFVEIFSGLTLVFGVIAVFTLGNGSMSIMSLSTPFGLYISIGAILALVAVVLAYGVIVPSARKMIEIAQSLSKSPGPPPPEMTTASKRLRVGSTAAMVLLILVTIFMVAGATL